MFYARVYCRVLHRVGPRGEKGPAAGQCPSSQVHSWPELVARISGQNWLLEMVARIGGQNWLLKLVARIIGQNWWPALVAKLGG